MEHIKIIQIEIKAQINHITKKKEKKRKNEKKYW